VLIEELKSRWQQMFDALAAGDDLPPGVRLRAEGLMEAALLVGEATEAEIDATMGVCYRQAFGRDLAAEFGDDWREFHPFPQIPAMARRAPVFPSTRD
jgi:hypothetical protein